MDRYSISMSLSGLAPSFFIYFTNVLAFVQFRTIISKIIKQGYGLDRKGTWKRSKKVTF